MECARGGRYDSSKHVLQEHGAVVMGRTRLTHESNPLRHKQQRSQSTYILNLFHSKKFWLWV